MFKKLSILFVSGIIFSLLVCVKEYTWDKARIVVFTRHEDRLPALVRLDGDSIGMLFEVAADTSLYPAYGSKGTVSFQVDLGTHNIYARTPDDPITGIFYFWSFDIEIDKIGTYCYHLDKSDEQTGKCGIENTGKFDAALYTFYMQNSAPAALQCKQIVLRAGG